MAVVQVVLISIWLKFGGTASVHVDTSLGMLLDELQKSMSLPVPRHAASKTFLQPLEVRCMDKSHEHDNLQMAAPSFMQISNSTIACRELGLFAKEVIPAGSIIQTFAGDMKWLYKEDGNQLKAALLHVSKKLRRKFASYAYGDTAHPGVLFFERDEGRYMNGGVQGEINTKETHEGTVASRDIAAGEELLTDYGQLTEGPDWWTDDVSFAVEGPQHLRPILP